MAHEIAEAMASKECKCKHVEKCVYRVAKLVLKAATVCALCHVAKELHKVHKAIEHKSHHKFLG